MLPDFKIISHKFLDRPDIEIWPLFDPHFGAEEHNTEEWHKILKTILSRENAYVILGGDLINNATRSGISDVFREQCSPSIQKQKMAEMLKPLADDGRILCGVPGNHERRSQKDCDDNPAYDIFAKLNIEHLYRENIAFVRIKMGGEGGAGQRNPCYILAVTHGAGGGSKYASMVNKSVEYGSSIDGCDILVVGHSHKPFVAPPAKISVDPQHGIATIKPFYVVVATAWMNYGGYAVQKMLPPVSIAPQVIKLYGKKKKIEVTM